MRSTMLLSTLLALFAVTSYGSPAPADSSVELAERSLGDVVSPAYHLRERALEVRNKKGKKAKAKKGGKKGKKVAAREVDEDGLDSFITASPVAIRSLADEEAIAELVAQSPKKKGKKAKGPKRMARSLDDDESHDLVARGFRERIAARKAARAAKKAAAAAAAAAAAGGVAAGAVAATAATATVAAVAPAAAAAVSTDVGVLAADAAADNAAKAQIAAAEAAAKSAAPASPTQLAAVAAAEAAAAASTVSVGGAVSIS